MAKANSGITKVADLKGKKIASQVGSTLDNVFKKRIAPEAGLQASDYSIVNVQFSDQVAALAAGSVDAFLGLEPFCAIAEYRKLAVQLTDYYKYDTIPDAGGQHGFRRQASGDLDCVPPRLAEGRRLVQAEPR